ncbi:MAG: hypothetical protein KatS3mg103_1351 [Phycisphaerales bacterium]|nr:MAG: hypothetical protein KatS3mg103_1351 [Phycisphaerales bacterium]
MLALARTGTPPKPPTTPTTRPLVWAFVWAFVWALAAGLLVGASGCAATPAQGPVQTSPWPTPFGQGLRLRSAHYELYTTVADRSLAEAMPAFLEAALDRHRRVAGSRLGRPALPAPPRPMVVFLFADRAQWASFTQASVDPSAGPLLAIEVGGYAVGGRAVFFALPQNDRLLTLRIAAHEGWHQYVQRAFVQRPPIWADELLAVLAEGVSIDPQGRVRFDPADNPQRREHLAQVLAEDRWRSLPELLTLNPADLLAQDPSLAVDYYAQLWALGLHLREQPDLWAGVQALLRDAAFGRLPRSDARAANPSAPAGDAAGVQAFTAYVHADLDGLERAYLELARALAGEASAAGRSGSTPR